MFERIKPEPVLKGKDFDIKPLDEPAERHEKPRVKLVLEIRRYHLA